MSSELLSKVEELKKVLKRCSAIVESDPDHIAVKSHNDKEISKLTSKVTDLQATLLELRGYSRRLEDELKRLKEPKSTSSRPEEPNNVNQELDSVGDTDAQFDDNEQEALLSVFRYLPVLDLVRVQRVCRLWCRVAKHPLLWQRLVLVDLPISHQTLRKIAPYCRSTRVIHFQGLIPHPALLDEDLQAYISRQKASLEPGLDCILNECGSILSHLTISECPLLLTERCLWLISKHCTNLQSFVYYSNEFPPTAESLWSLANSCTSLKELHLCPSDDLETCKRFTNKCLKIVSNGFPLLTSLTIGGNQITVPEISSSIGVLLKYLKHLQIINGPPITVSCVTNHIHSSCFSGLHTLVLDHTRISPQAVVKLIETHPELKTLELTVAIVDYFPGQSLSSDAIDIGKYKRIVENLEALAKHYRYRNIFKLSHE